MLVLGGVSGIPDTPERFREGLPGVLRAGREVLDSVRNAVLSPVSFVPEQLQFSQHWRLFSSASGARFLMWVELRTSADAPWQLLYRPHDPEHSWMDEALEYRRVRGNWNPSRKGPNRGYEDFATWIARRVFEERPDARVVRVRMEGIDVLPRGAGIRATGEFFHERTRRREDVLR